MITADGLCLVCIQEDETVLHVLWTCPVAVDVWGESVSHVRKWHTVYRDFILIWRDLFQSYTHQSTLDDIAVYKEVAQVQKKQNTRNGVQMQTIGRTLWKPAEDPFFKLNFDPTFVSDENFMGIGIVLRDCRGDAEVVLAAPRRYVNSMFQTECYALLRGLQLCHELGFHHVIFEGDAKHVIDSIHGDMVQT
ncbi:uncharacterized protein LOC121253427 [Juglans microcarpa x Juglans regia]|uniref:uncharacterized protein LOC121253427 n=1 Tax=Juglans microcarpa x Juglans regia TaxID=2249226 RepID=UPI001B7EE46C|nr:uncharacterized protein LOC121253427 [Juglans microcarpa x Juglans regia]